MSINHYENFPVASLLLPAHLRPAVKILYAFARSADDLADEGDAVPAARLQALTAYEQELAHIQKDGISQHPLFGALGKVVKKYQLPLQPMQDLLSAFKQDVTTKRYSTFEALLDYCRRSANPVGILLLHLYRSSTKKNVADSDAICTALQLINFWQDVAIDWEKQRIYIPQQDLDRFGITEAHIAEARTDDAWRALMRFEVARTRALMLSGAPLALQLPGRIGWELRLIVHGGLRILERIEAVDYDVFRRRPQLGAFDWLHILWRAAIMKISLSRMGHVG